MKLYVNPKISLIDSNRIKDISYYIWLNSRIQIVNKSNIPGNIIVGHEDINEDEYKKRVDKMNLQYNNFDYYTFRINGSCLFRDILYNVNHTSQWAESLRFAHSIKTEFSEDGYPISSEYKDIEEWEDQFNKYMKAVENDKDTDRNRIEMPYSLSTKFWWSCTKKKFLSVISMLKLKMPFFYKYYGEEMLTAAGFTEDDLLPFFDTSLSQYVTKDYEEGRIINSSGFVILQQKMSLILYSQFIRQSDVVVSGLYNDLIHNNMDEFKHKIFYGNSLINVSYCASIDKVRTTVKARTCNFAQSSGDKPWSWSPFINNFIKSVNTVEEFKELLPCKFDEKGVCECKYYDVTKFRADGTEKSGVVCPLHTLKISDAKKKLDRDEHNKLSQLYYKLVEDMNSHNCIPYLNRINESK